MATTTNFGWETPDDTDLVKDGALAMRTLGNAIDTSLVDLKGGTTGQVLSKTSNTDMDFTWVTSDDANAIQNAIVDAKGDLITATAADTPARLAVGSNGESLVADSAASTGLRWQGNFSAAKNKIINGDFYWNQRGFSSSTTTGAYNFDRWQQVFSGGTQTISPQTFTLGSAPVAGYEGKTFCRIVTASQAANGDYSAQTQKIESVRTFAGQTVTVSFWAKASTGTPNIGISGLQNFGTGGSPSSNVIVTGTTQAISSSWARYSATLTVPSISGKTIGSNNDDHFRVDIWTSAGTTISGLGYPAVGLQNVTIDIWGVQLEAGSVATAFQTATGNLQSELAACQRYYFRFTGPSVYSSYGQGYYESTTGGNIDLPYPVTLRTQPSSIDFANVAVQDSGGGLAGVTALTINQSSLKTASLNFTVASGGTAHRPLRFLNNNNAAGYVGLNAEL